MARQRKTYTAEFKLNAVQMVTDQKLSVAEAARRLGIGENLLRLWKQAFLDRGTDAFPGHGRLSPADEELHCAPGLRRSARCDWSSRRSRRRTRTPRRCRATGCCAPTRVG